tara:strand:+ start:443 stop:688 length:246 start_codon:yes stop_codon:yes gene_type:complete
MPALTHGRVKNGYNGHSSACSTNSCGGQGFNPIRNSKVYRYPVNGANTNRSNELPGSVGVSKATKNAWLKRANLKNKCCGK